MPSQKAVLAISVILLQVLDIAIIVMVGVWMGHYRGGFAWDGTFKEFNYHPVCMIVSMIFLNSEAMIVFRVFSEWNRFKLKLLHMSIQVIAFAFGTVGLKAVFDFHNFMGFTNMYSLHSWTGLLCFILFSCQLACGFFGFLYPVFPDGLRMVYLKVHKYFGASIFFLAVGTSLTGIMQKIRFALKTDYESLPPEAVFVNILALGVVIHAGLVYFIVSNEDFKQTVAPEEQQRLMDISGEQDEND
ncbi:cytochrome b561-like [Dendronephthya gigantea]|uniref:cytochrome b561-like n=1 Tax=Dendronephthya gigantea TaxID=151771 RepID=UPI00106B60FD|nr:cytochrome b561-like [Dendronephthya gigantea]